MGKEVIRCGECQYFMRPEHICEKANGSGWGNDDDDGCTFGKRITNYIKQENEGVDKMAEYIGGEEKKTSVGEPLIFENQTDHSFEVRTGIVFNSSGIYEIVRAGNRTIVSKVLDINNKWIPLTKDTIPPYWELVWVTNKRGQVDVCQLGHTEHFWYSREEEWRYEFDSIIAWMPYEEPEPYKEKGDC